MKQYIQSFFSVFGCLSFLMIFVYSLVNYAITGSLDNSVLDKEDFLNITSFLTSFVYITLSSLIITLIIIISQRHKEKTKDVKK
jgi:uncharacterized BrkB/YihY/UPF0761 family membrane protein